MRLGNTRLQRLLPAVLGFLLTGGALPAGVVFNFIFQDVVLGNGIGFDDPVQGATRRNTLSGFLNTAIGQVLDYTSTVDIRVDASQTDGTGFLAEAGSLYTTTGSNVFRQGLVYQHLTTGLDPNLSNPDGIMTWDFGRNWAIDTDPLPGQYDFRTVALHEMTHALGFISLINGSGASRFGNNIWAYYDQYLVDSALTPLIHPTTKTFQASTGDLISEVFFNGPAAVSVYGGPVPLYTPATFALGSSLSHFDQDDTGPIPLSTELMSFSIAQGEVNRAWSELERAFLSDLGYALVPIPEPAALPLALALLALLATRLRRPS